MPNHGVVETWQTNENGTNFPLPDSTYDSVYQGVRCFYVVKGIESDRVDTFDPRKPAISLSVTKF